MEDSKQPKEGTCNSCSTEGHTDPDEKGSSNVATMVHVEPDEESMTRLRRMYLDRVSKRNLLRRYQDLRMCVDFAFRSPEEWEQVKRSFNESKGITRIQFNHVVFAVKNALLWINGLQRLLDVATKLKEELVSAGVTELEMFAHNVMTVLQSATYLSTHFSTTINENAQLAGNNNTTIRKEEWCLLQSVCEAALSYPAKLAPFFGRITARLAEMIGPIEKDTHDGASLPTGDTATPPPGPFVTTASPFGSEVPTHPSSPSFSGSSINPSPQFASTTLNAMPNPSNIIQNPLTSSTSLGHMSYQHPTAIIYAHPSNLPAHYANIGHGKFTNQTYHNPYAPTNRGQASRHAAQSTANQMNGNPNATNQRPGLVITGTCRNGLNLGKLDKEDILRAVFAQKITSAAELARVEAIKRELMDLTMGHSANQPS